MMLVEAIDIAFAWNRYYSSALVRLPRSSRLHCYAKGHIGTDSWFQQLLGACAGYKPYHTLV